MENSFEKYLYSLLNFLLSSVRHGWAEALTEIQPPYVKIICPNAYVCLFFAVISPVSAFRIHTVYYFR